MEIKIGKEKIEIKKEHVMIYGEALLTFVIIGILSALLFAFIHSVISNSEFLDSLYVITDNISHFYGIISIILGFTIFNAIKKSNHKFKEIDIVSIVAIHFVFSMLIDLPSIYNANPVFGLGLSLGMIFISISNAFFSAASLYIFIVFFDIYKKFEIRRADIILTVILLVLFYFFILRMTFSFDLYFRYGDLNIPELAGIFSYITGNVLNIIDYINYVVFVFIILIYFIYNKGKINKYFYFIFLFQLLVIYMVGFDILISVFPRFILFLSIYLAGRYFVQKQKLLKT